MPTLAPLPGATGPGTRMTKLDLSPAQEAWAKLLHQRNGGGVVATFGDPTQGAAVPIYYARNAGGAFAATLGLMDTSQTPPTEKPIWSELMLVRRGADETVCNLLATAALYILKDGWRVAPGVIFESLVSMYYPDTRLPHLYFTVPSMFDGMERVELGERTLHPLIGFPISERESQLARTDRGDALESLWESKATDVMDWNRPSVL